MTNQSPKNKTPLLTIRQAANLLNLSVPTIKNYIYDGKLRSVKTPGGHHRIHESDLRSLMGDETKEFSEKEAINLIIAGLMRVIEERESFTKNHAEAVASLSAKIAENLGLSDIQKQNLQIAALLHDIGKISIPKGLLNKSTLLTNDERSAIRKHSQLGEEIAQSIEPFSRISSIIRQHHERFDGTGYPDERYEDQIRIEAKIIAVAEAFDFMTTKRAYRDPMPLERALSGIEKASNSQFDPVVVEAFLKTQNT